MHLMQRRSDYLTICGSCAHHVLQLLCLVCKRCLFSHFCLSNSRRSTRSGWGRSSRAWSDRRPRYCRQIRICWMSTIDSRVKLTACTAVGTLSGGPVGTPCCWYRAQVRAVACMVGDLRKYSSPCVAGKPFVIFVCSFWCLVVVFDVVLVCGISRSLLLTCGAWLRNPCIVSLWLSICCVCWCLCVVDDNVFDHKWRLIS